MRATGHHKESHEAMNERHHGERRAMHTRHEREMKETAERHAAAAPAMGAEPGAMPDEANMGAGGTQPEAAQAEAA